MQDRALFAVIARNPETGGASTPAKADRRQRPAGDLVNVCMARWPGGIGEQPLFQNVRP